MGRHTRTARALDDARETVAAWALRISAANKRMAELERELVTTRERLSQQQNETTPLKKSLDSTIAENSRLSERYSEIAEALEKANARAERARRERIAAEAERDEAVRTSIERAAALKQKLPNSSAEGARAQGQVEAVLRQKEQQIQALRQAQSTLLEGIKSRDTALAGAGERIGKLSERLFELEANANQRMSEGPAGNIETLLSDEPLARRDPQASGKAARVTSAMLKRDLENDAWLFGGLGAVRPS